MLASKYRIPRGSRLTHPQSFRHPYVVVKYASNNLEYSRFSVVIRKKVDKHATGRNRMRRLLQTFIQEYLPQIQPGYDMLFLVQQPFSELSEQQKQELAELFQKRGLYADSAGATTT